MYSFKGVIVSPLGEIISSEMVQEWLGEQHVDTESTRYELIKKTRRRSVKHLEDRDG